MDKGRRLRQYERERIDNVVQKKEEEEKIIEESVEKYMDKGRIQYEKERTEIVGEEGRRREG